MLYQSKRQNTQIL